MTKDDGAGLSPRPRGPSLRSNLLLAAAGLIASLLLCELLLRLLGVSYPVFVWTDPVRGVGHVPGAKSQKQYKGRPLVEINSDGWRGPDIALGRSPGTIRVALLGDSFIEAFEVPFEKTVGEVLGRRLSTLLGTPVEVLNFGHGGYGTTQELLTLQHEVWKYSPDLILLGMTLGNDISDNYRPLKQSDYVPYHVFRDTTLQLDSSFLQSRGYQSRALWTRNLLGLVQHSRLVQVLNRARYVRRHAKHQRRNVAQGPVHEVGLDDQVNLPPTTPEWHEAWRVTEGVLRLMRDEARRNETPLAVVTLTRGMQVTPRREERKKYLDELGGKDLYYPERRVAAFGDREGIPVLNLAPAMAKQAEERQVFFHADQDSVGIGHWNEEGHQAAAELTASWIAREWQTLRRSSRVGLKVVDRE
jgi:hypothetical protein